MSVYQLHLIESANANFTASVIAQLCDGFGIVPTELFVAAPPLAKRRVGRPKTPPEVRQGAEEEPRQDAEVPRDK
jgi:hypothetical protein